MPSRAIRARPGSAPTVTGCMSIRCWDHRAVVSPSCNTRGADMTPPEPVVVHDVETDDWTVKEEYVVSSRGFTFVIPKGRVTDFASIPRIFWNVEAPFQL